MEEEFVLPEKYCVKNPYNNESQLLYDYVNSSEEGKKGFLYPYTQGTYFHFPKYNSNSITSTDVEEGYTEITFEQFKKHVLNQDMEKKIIGYVLKNKDMYDAASVIAFGNTDGSFYWDGDIPDNRESVLDPLRKAGVLDLWFEPVYEPEYKVGDYVYVISAEIGAKGSDQKVGIVTNEIATAGLAFTEGFTQGIKVNIDGQVWSIGKNAKVRKATPEEIESTKKPLITINGYKGEFFDTYVKFGCAEISKEVFIDLDTINEYKHTNREVESVTIGKGTFTKEQIREIAEYYGGR
jgi:hypothetical protein